MSELDDLFGDIDQHFKTRRGDPTYSRQERELIESKVVPEWLLRGQRLLEGTADGARCTKALDALRGLHAAVWPQVKFERTSE